MKKRRKDRYNPYTLIEVKEKNIYIIAFKDISGTYLNVKVSKEVYDVLDKSELIDISQMHEFERHIEHFDLDEYSLFNKAVNKGISLEDKIERNMLIDDLKYIIINLPKIQKSRLIKYFFENKTYEQIAKEEHCTKRAVKFSVDLAIKKISEKLKK